MASELPVSSSTCGDTWTGLSRLAAQAAQILEVSGKITDSGGDGTGLRESMQDELGGLRAAIDYVIGQNGLDWAAVNRQRDRRRALYGATGRKAGRKGRASSGRGVTRRSGE